MEVSQDSASGSLSQAGTLWSFTEDLFRSAKRVALSDQHVQDYQLWKYAQYRLDEYRSKHVANSNNYSAVSGLMQGSNSSSGATHSSWTSWMTSTVATLTGASYAIQHAFAAAKSLMGGATSVLPTPAAGVTAFEAGRSSVEQRQSLVDMDQVHRIGSKELMADLGELLFATEPK